MTRLVLALFALASAFWGISANADPADIAAASRSVVRVVLISQQGGEVALIGHGSGFAVGPDLIVTNAHVIALLAEDDSLRVAVIPSQGTGGWFAKVAAYSPRNDLALLRLTEKGALAPATLFPGAVVDGEDVFAVGYPGNVDLAQGLRPGDIVSPTSPVKTHGSVSSGRSSRQFDTILHTAAIGAGNSGGPLLDACGRVIGVNSFGTVNENVDSSFYFAVSMREIMRFLRDAGVSPRSSALPCRSLADLDKAEAARSADEKAMAEQQARIAAERQSATMTQAERQAQLEIISERENGMALTGIGLLLALVVGGAGIALRQKERPRDVKIAAVACVLLLIGAIAAWVTRPSLGDIDTRARKLAAEAAPTQGASASPAAVAVSGDLVCMLNTERSRVTVSDITDVPLNWRKDGCVNNRTQYGLGADGWSRILAPKQEDNVTVASFDPGSATYKTKRYLLDLDTMEKLRAERAKYTPPTCGGGEEEARKLGQNQAAVKALLPAEPNERLVYHCRAADGAAPR